VDPLEVETEKGRGHLQAVGDPMIEFPKFPFAKGQPLAKPDHFPAPIILGTVHASVRPWRRARLAALTVVNPG
jgi:hypothetical protein